MTVTCFDEFFAHAVAVVQQAKNSQGNLDADVMAEANNTYWDPYRLARAWPDERVRGQRTASEHHGAPG
jgi:hypothetical protein